MSVKMSNALAKDAKVNINANTNTNANFDSTQARFGRQLRSAFADLEVLFPQTSV